MSWSRPVRGEEEGKGKEEGQAGLGSMGWTVRWAVLSQALQPLGPQ